MGMEELSQGNTEEKFKEKMEWLLLLWKLLLIVDFVSGMHGLECQLLTTISIFWVVLRFFRDLTAGRRIPAINFIINNKEHNPGYYLVDGIYPDWHIFVKTILEPRGAKCAHFSMVQEAQCKDVK